MIPQHCRQGREQGTVLIRQALSSGKVLKGMQAIVGNCSGQHSSPSDVGVTCPELKREVYLLLVSAFILFLCVMVGLGIALVSYQFAEAHMEHRHMFTEKLWRALLRTFTHNPL